MKVKRRASFTIEAAVIMAVYIMGLGTLMNFGISLYQDVLYTTGNSINKEKITTSQILRLKHMGGELYEEYKERNNIQEETE